jgi:hypothetical protein
MQTIFAVDGPQLEATGLIVLLTDGTEPLTESAAPCPGGFCDRPDLTWADTKVARRLPRSSVDRDGQFIVVTDAKSRDE